MGTVLLTQQYPWGDTSPEAEVVSQPQGKAIIRDVEDMMSLALKCVYTVQSEELLVVHKDIDRLEDHLR